MVVPEAIQSPWEPFKVRRFAWSLTAVDYFATVWLNGEKLGQHEGAYVPFEFDVTGKVLNGENQRPLKVTCPWLPEGRGFLEYMKGELAEVVPRTSLPVFQALPTAMVLELGWASCRRQRGFPDGPVSRREACGVRSRDTS